MMNESTALAIIDEEPIERANTLVLPLGTPAEMHAAMQRYQATKEAVLDPSDYQSTGQGKFIKKSGWSKLAIAFGVSSEIVSREYHRDADGQLIGAEFTVRAIAPNGRYAEGLGRCSIEESRFKQPSARQKAFHDVPATAETRARNRACAALFGHGEMSAEEVAEEPIVEQRQDVYTLAQKITKLAKREKKTEADIWQAAYTSVGVKKTAPNNLGPTDVANLIEWADAQLATEDSPPAEGAQETGTVEF